VSLPVSKADDTQREITPCFLELKTDVGVIPTNAKTIAYSELITSE